MAVETIRIDDLDRHLHRIFPVWVLEDALRVNSGRLVLISPQRWQDPGEDLCCRMMMDFGHRQQIPLERQLVVWSRVLMVRIWFESIGLACPAFADVSVGCEAAQGLQAAAIVVGIDEVAEVSGQLAMAVVMIAFDGRFLDCAVYPLDLAVGPRVLDLGQAVLNAALVTDPVEDMVEGIYVVGVIGELDTVVGQHRMDRIGHSLDQVAQELGGDHLAGLCMQLDEHELAGTNLLARTCWFGRSPRTGVAFPRRSAPRQCRYGSS